MLNQSDKARLFASLHRPGNPLFLYNIWDAGGARAIADIGAPAIATGSMSMALAHGFEDGQQIPFDLVLAIVSRICQAVEVPVTVDFEGGYADELDGLAENTERLVAAGPVGVNFEDQVIGGTGLHATSAQCERIAAIRAVAPDLFINARTDLFLQEKDKSRHAGLVDAAIERAKAYLAAGASGFFVPGLTDLGLIERVCDGVGGPVNVMRIGSAPSVAELASVGVARISCGPAPYREFVAGLKAAFMEAGR